MSRSRDAALNAITTSNLFSEMGLSFSNKMAQARENGEIDAIHFLSFQANVVRPLMDYALKMSFDASSTITEGIGEQFNEIKEGSDGLKESLNHIAKTQRVIAAAAQLLATAALIVTFFGAPALASGTAAISSLGELLTTLKKSEED